LPPLGDVADDAEGLDHVSGGVAAGNAGHVMDPLLSTSRMQVAILDVEPFELPLVHLLAQVQHTLAIVRVQVLDPELECFQVLLRSRGDAADVAKPVVHEGGTFR